ncbi:MAG: type III-B CRISPR module-associated Cmr3 family protein [Pseudonocardiaceae bacterium]
MIRVKVRAEQPLHLGSQLDAGWLTDTHRFVPGSVLRGALAAIWLAEHRLPQLKTTDDVEFHQLFEGGVRFGPLYPSDDALRPLSVFGCKYANSENCRRFTHDAAFDGAAPADCPACGSPVEASNGHVDGAQVVEHTRVQLDERERAAEGQLYTRRALRAGTWLTGLIDGDPDRELAWLMQTERSVRLGGRRSTSGLATLSAGVEALPTSFTGFVPDQRRLVVRLLAPGIFVDDLGRPSWLPDITELSAMLGVPVAFDAAFARPAVVSGWHAVSNLPKPRDFAVAAGSVFVLRFDENLPDHAGLQRLWHTGLGLRRVEGNGWITLQRWSAPALPRAERKPPPDAVHDLFLQIVGYGVGPTIVDDLRGWAQQRHVGAPQTADDVLAKQRYSRLSPEALDTVRAAFALSADDAERLARRIDEWTRSRTSARGRIA